MRSLFRLAGKFLVAVLCTHILASTLVTHHVLGRVADMGMLVSFPVRVASTGHDIVGLATSYLPLIAAGFLIAFTVAALFARRTPSARAWLYAAAGGVAIVTVNLSLTAAFDIVPIASARSLAGLIGQGAAGALGGLLFWKLL